MAFSDSIAGDIVYGEVNAFPVWVYALMTIACLCFLAALIAGIVLWNLAAIVIGSVFLVLTAIASFAFNHMEFVITDRFIRFGFPLVQKKFPRSDLVLCEPFELVSRNFYYGVGIRRGRDETRAYCHRMGPGVRLTFRGAKVAYVVPVDKPEKICEILCAP